MSLVSEFVKDFNAGEDILDISKNMIFPPKNILSSIYLH